MEAHAFDIWFAENSLAPTTNKLCDFSLTLACNLEVQLALSDIKYTI